MRRWQLAVEEGADACGALLLFHTGSCDTRTLEALLSRSERERAARFHFPEHARRFIAAHGRLRQVLAEVLQMPPGQLEFATGAHGKPLLAGAASASDIRFNLSHSGDWALIGWSRQRDIGVDIESWRPMRDEQALVRRFFSPAEIAAYAATDTELRSRAFFDAWSRKEAYVKAVGRGLGLPLDSFDVSLHPADARLLRASTHCEDGRCWSLAAPRVAIDASIAVVIEADSLVVRNAGS